MARPKKVIDEVLLEKLASLQCSISEMASVLECHPDTLRDRFSTIIDKGRDRGKMSLRRKQIDVALGGNTVMLIWLGKQYLDQADKLDQKAVIEARHLIEQVNRIKTLPMAQALKEMEETMKLLKLSSEVSLNAK